MSLLRAPPSDATDNSIAFEFQVLEVNVQNVACPTFDVSDSRLLAADVTYQQYGSYNQQYNKQGPCVVYLFGVTRDGASVCCKVDGFQPFLYVELTPQVTNTVLQEWKLDLAKKARVSMDVELVRKKRVYGWVPATREDVTAVRTFDFACLHFPTVAAMNTAFYILQAHNNGDSGGYPSLLKIKGHKVDVSEVKVQASEKFMAKRQLKASGWIQVTAGTYTMCSLQDRCTIATHELQCHMNSLLPVERDEVAPLVIAAVDIEVQSSDFRSFPDADNEGDVCSYIGTTFWVYGEKQPRLKVMQVLGTCDPVEGILIQSFTSELDLLAAWRDLIVLHTDPDKLVSYNGTGFDFAYMSKRYEKLRLRSGRYSRFLHLGKLLFLQQRLYTRELMSAAMGQNEMSVFPMSGRWQMDLFQYIKTNYKLSSYKLDDVCKHFLGNAGGQTKVVLDLPGWVYALVTSACGAIRAFIATHAVDAGDGADLVVQLDYMCRLAEQPLQTQPESASGEAELTQVLDDDEEEFAADGASRWQHVQRAVDKATDMLFHLLRDKPHLKDDVDVHLLDAHIRPLLDACGSDNYKKLFRLYEHSAGARAAIAQYCQVDCDLVLYLLDRVSVVPNTVQMSQVTNTLLSDIANRGQQIKTFNLIARYAHNNGFVMNFRDVQWDAGAEYEGATVLPPQPGYYQRPVATLDFASLYPSIMQAYNLCFSSIVLDAEYQNLESAGAKYGRYNIGSKTWVFQEHVRGLLPEILANLVSERRKSKKDMVKFPKGSLDYKLADGKQLALKISCNSVYGFTGALALGMFPCMPVAVATTFNGRTLIDQTKRFVESQYGATVIYGDTDSVMLQFPGVDTVHQAFILAEQVARECSATFRDVVQLEFEKVYFPYLLIKKKHYAGIKYEGDPDEPPTLDAKGLALVRRDNCKLVRDTMREVLLHAMRNNNPMAAYEAVQRQVQRLVNREVDLAELEISNFLRKDLKDDNHPHIQVVKNMTARGSFGVPRVGDRVPYCILEGTSPQVFKRAEHPKFIAEQGLKIDLEYYLRRQMQQRLEKVLKPLPIPDADKLFDNASREIAHRRASTSRLSSFTTMFTLVASITAAPPAALARVTPTATRQGSLASMLPGVAHVTVAPKKVVKKRKAEVGNQSLSAFSSMLAKK